MLCEENDLAIHTYGYKVENVIIINKKIKVFLMGV